MCSKGLNCVLSASASLLHYWNYVDLLLYQLILFLGGQRGCRRDTYLHFINILHRLIGYWPFPPSSWSFSVAGLWWGQAAPVPPYPPLRNCLQINIWEFRQEMVSGGSLLVSLAPGNLVKMINPGKSKRQMSSFLLLSSLCKFLCKFLVIVKNRKDLPICVKRIAEITKYLAALTNCRKPIWAGNSTAQTKQPI